MKSYTLDELYLMVSSIYSEQNYQRSVSATFTHFVEVCGMLTVFARDKKRDEVDFESAICKALGWYFPLISKCGIISLEEVIFRKYPYACPYCRLKPHVVTACKEIKGTANTVNHLELRKKYAENISLKPKSLNEWQTMFQEIYPRNPSDKERSMIGLMEELGELAEAIRIYDRHPKFFVGEIADIFSYLMGIANEYSMKLQIDGKPPLDLETEFIKRYPGLCIACGNIICTCPSVPEATIGRMSKELNIGDDEKIFGLKFDDIREKGLEISYNVISSAGGVSSILKELPLDRGQVNQSLVYVCIKIAEIISETNSSLSEKLMEAAVTIGSKATPAGGKKHDLTINSLLDIMKEAIRSLPAESTNVMIESSDRLISEVSKMVGTYRILLVTSTPLDQTHIHVDGEARKIQKTIFEYKDKGSIYIKHLPAATIDDFKSELIKNEYDIIHFSGHGDKDTISFSDEDGNTEDLDLSVLKDIVACNESIKVVILNSCNSLEEFVEPIAQYTVGMNEELNDGAAIEFSKGFYEAVCNGKPLKYAIEWGIITAKSHGYDEVDLPIKVINREID